MLDKIELKIGLITRKAKASTLQTFSTRTVDPYMRSPAGGQERGGFTYHAAGVASGCDVRMWPGRRLGGGVRVRGTFCHASLQAGAASMEHGDRRLRRTLLELIPRNPPLEVSKVILQVLDRAARRYNCFHGHIATTAQ